MNNRTTTLLMALAVFGWAAPAEAQDVGFTFTVPVELHSVEAQHAGFQVRCEIQVDGTGIAQGFSPVMEFDADGNYTGGPLIVPITNPVLTDAQKLAVNSYICSVSWTEGGGTTPLEDEAKPGTAFVIYTSGPINQGD